MKPEINFPYVADKKPIAKPEPDHNYLKGMTLAVLTGICVAMILIFALVPGAGEMFDKEANYYIAMNTMYLIIGVSAVLIGLIWAFKKD